MRRFAVLLVAAAMLTLSFAARRARAGEADTEESVSKARRVEIIAAQKREIQRRREQIETMHNIILKQQCAVEVAKANLRNAQKQRIEAEAELKKAPEELDRLRKENARLRVTLGLREGLMEDGPVARAFRTGPQPEAAIEAKVLDVRPEIDLVMLSVGSLDGVKEGYRFTIYRGERYIGKVEVEKVFADMSSAKILADWTKEPIKENDDAATRVFGKPPPRQPHERGPSPLLSRARSWPFARR